MGFNQSQLRGVLAVYIALYHFYAWGLGTPADWAVILAQYGVGLFFAMSGYGLTSRYKSSWNLGHYLRRRVWRIIPLFWAVTTLKIILNGGVSIKKAILNFSLLFGFLGNTEYIVTGGWAIGCLIVFYVLFALWAAARFPMWMLWVALIGSLAFAQSVLEPVHLSDQWAAWVNPITQLGLFAGGCLIAQSTPKRAWLGYAGMAFVACFPASIAFTWLHPFAVLCCLLVVADSGQCRGGSWLGRWSYEIYLIHPFLQVLNNP